jgi:hypothetical protein
MQANLRSGLWDIEFVVVGERLGFVQVESFPRLGVKPLYYTHTRQVYASAKSKKSPPLKYTTRSPASTFGTTGLVLLAGKSVIFVPSSSSVKSDRSENRADSIARMEKWREA